MLTAAAEELDARAERMRAALEHAGAEATVERAHARAGGGSLPLLELEGPVCAVAPGALGLEALGARLRIGDPPVIARAAGGRLLLDPRTLDDEGADAAAAAVAAALAAR
jgi:L-seryl-tRNA(Ser) seleniumtransferase